LEKATDIGVKNKGTKRTKKGRSKGSEKGREVGGKGRQATLRENMARRVRRKWIWSGARMEKRGENGKQL